MKPVSTRLRMINIVGNRAKELTAKKKLLEEELKVKRNNPPIMQFDPTTPFSHQLFKDKRAELMGKSIGEELREITSVLRINEDFLKKL
jgi:hypothetical protein